MARGNTAHLESGPSDSVGVIRADEIYTLSEVKRRLDITDATLRAARRAGFKVIYKHGRGYVFGADLIGYLTAADTNGSQTSNP